MSTILSDGLFLEVVHLTGRKHYFGNLGVHKRRGMVPSRLRNSRSMGEGGQFSHICLRISLIRLLLPIKIPV